LRSFSSRAVWTRVPIRRIVEMPPPTAASVKATSIECMLTHTRAMSRRVDGGQHRRGVEAADLDDRDRGDR
jgi:hypothetical protein